MVWMEAFICVSKGHKTDKQETGRSREHQPIAICPTMSDERSQSRPAPLVGLYSLRFEIKSVLDAVIAGMIPTRIPDAMDASVANVRTRRLTPALAARGMLAPTSDKTRGVQVGKAASGEAACYSEQKAFHQQLSDDPVPACAQCGAHGKFALSLANAN